MTQLYLGTGALQLLKTDKFPKKRWWHEIAHFVSALTSKNKWFAFKYYVLWIDICLNWWFLWIGAPVLGQSHFLALRGAYHSWELQCWSDDDSRDTSLSRYANLSLSVFSSFVLDSSFCGGGRKTVISWTCQRNFKPSGHPFRAIRVGLVHPFPYMGLHLLGAV